MGNDVALAQTATKVLVDVEVVVTVVVEVPKEIKKRPAGSAKEDLNPGSTMTGTSGKRRTGRLSLTTFTGSSTFSWLQFKTNLQQTKNFHRRK